MRELLKGFGLFVSAAALCLLVGTTLSGMDRLEAMDIQPEPSERWKPDDRAKIEAEARRLEAAEALERTAAAAEAAAAEEAAARIVVPDLGRMNAARARRTLRELGLNLRVVDEYRDPIALRDLSIYRVRASSFDPPVGTAVEPGTTIRARGVFPAGIGTMGY